MVQKTYHADNETDFDKVITEIDNDHIVCDKDHTMIILHERNYEKSVIKNHLGKLTESFPEIHVIGMTMIGPLSDRLRIQFGSTISVISFTDSFFNTFIYDCSIMSPQRAAVLFSSELEKLPDLKGIFFVSSDSTLEPDDFLKNISNKFNHIPIFGSKAGSKSVDANESLIFLDNDIYSTGIVVVPICGKNIHIFTGCSFGWKLIGREMTVTDVDNDGYVRQIDDRKAMSVYNYYLKIIPGSHFFTESCAFPFVMNSEGIKTSRVPLMYNKDGGIRFTGKMNVGDKVSFAYAKNEYLLKESIDLFNQVIDFEPEAVYTSVCINRRIFLGNILADREINYMKYAFDNMIAGSGLGEILYRDGKGGFLNSCIVAVAMREGSVDLPHREHITDRYATLGAEEISLADRLVTFLEATSKELRNTINDLTVQASHDIVTGIYNRTWTDKVLKEDVEEVEKYAGLLTIMLFDIDNFKSINDTYGHTVGDEVLHKIASDAEDIIGSDNIIGRWGGDEFLCIFRGKCAKEVLPIAEMIKYAVKNENFSPATGITISGGISSFEIGDYGHEMLIRADRALYHSKHNGRNLISLYSDKYKNEMSLVERV